MNNPASAVTAFGVLTLSLATTILSIKVYKNLVAEATGEQTERARDAFDHRASTYAVRLQLLERADVSWFTRMTIQLRTRWDLGGMLFGYPGDPFLRDERLLVFWASILIGTTLDLVVFRHCTFSSP